ncbi:MAG TPA: DegV family protein [Candidatus Scatomonas pullistercoris]|uniref:DegV family protein n=1 Tax=Candidatus Scatomonas pullistercoris TaxID=2840920 RepID=A0A9D1P0F3_9FIRM|nr:DegV family protein [Candidatus Scatomonas pullistercoris]
MPKTAIVTDSNSGITQSRAEELGITVMPMPFFVNGSCHYEDVDLSQEEFYRLLSDDTMSVSTSQPAPGEVIDLWKKLLKDYDEIVHIPMSSGLSASCGTALSLAEDFDGKVQVVNNHRISVTQYQSVMDAITLAEAGWDAAAIRSRLEEEKQESSIYIMVDSLKYLKKGGRITPAAAMIGTVLKLKPVLQIQGEKLDAFAKSRGVKAAKKTMLEAMHKDFDTRFAGHIKNGEMCLQIAYCYGMEAEVEEWRREVEQSFPGMAVHGDLLSLSIVCHTGPGCLAIASAKKVTV